MYLLLPLIFGVATGPSTQPPRIETHTCPNGLTVMVVENHSTPLITVEIAAKNGAMTEPPEYSGLSHLYEHMFFKANAVLSSQEAFMKRLSELGMEFNGTTGTERVNYFFTTTSDHLNDSMAFMRDAVVSPKFDAKELERERVVVTGEMDRNEASPYWHLAKAVDQKVWWKYPTRKDGLGLRSTVLKASVAQMQTIQHRYYVPNNSALVVAGDVSAADVFAQADTLYAGWKQAADPFKKYPLVTHPPIKKTEVVLVQQPVQQITGTITWHGPSLVGPSVPDSYTADAMFTAANLPSSHFQVATVDSGACIDASAGWYTQRNTGPITVGFNATPDKVDRCVKAIQGELVAMAKPEYWKQDDLHRAAHQIEVSTVAQLENTAGMAHDLTFWWTSASLDYYRGYIPHLYQVTPDQAARFMGTWITNQPYVMGILLSPAMVKTAKLDQAHFNTLLGIK